MRGVEIITYFIIGFIFLSRHMLYIYIKKVKLINIIIYFLFLLIKLIKFCSGFEILQIISYFAYAYFAYIMIYQIEIFIYQYRVFGAKFSFNPKINSNLIKAHYSVLRKQSKFKQFIILFFIGFKIKILINILTLKYIGYISCVGILYAQARFFSDIMRLYHSMNETLMRIPSYVYVKFKIGILYRKYMLAAYMVFFVSTIQFIIIFILKYLKRYYWI